MYVVLSREKGLFIIEPVEGKTQSEVIFAALGLPGGYSGGKVYVGVPEGATEVWVAWVEGESPDGQPSFNFRAFPSTMSEAEVTAQLAALGETPLKLNRSEIYHV